MGTRRPSDRAEADALLAGELRRELRFWRVDRVLGPVVLVAVLVVAAMALRVPFVQRSTAWSCVAFAPGAVALALAVAGGVRVWRRRRWRDATLDRLGATRLDRVRAGLLHGPVRERDRAPALRLLLNHGAVGGNLGWALLGAADGQAVELDTTAPGVGVRLVLGGVMVVTAVSSLVSTHRHVGRAARVLDESAGSTTSEFASDRETRR